MTIVTRRRLSLGLGLAAMTGACSKKSRKRAGNAADPFVIGVSQCNLGEPWRAQMNADLASAAASHPNLRLVFKDAQNDSLAQRAQVEELLNQGIDLLIISPKESAPLTKPVAEVFRRGVPVIVLDRAVDGEAYTCFIGADNRAIGRAAGAWVAKVTGGEANIVELKGLMTSTPGQDRHAGFREGIAKAPGLKVVFEGAFDQTDAHPGKLGQHPQREVRRDCVHDDLAAPRSGLPDQHGAS